MTFCQPLNSAALFEPVDGVVASFENMPLCVSAVEPSPVTEVPWLGPPQAEDEWSGKSKKALIDVQRTRAYNLACTKQSHTSMQIYMSITSMLIPSWSYVFI